MGQIVELTGAKPDSRSARYDPALSQLLALFRLLKYSRLAPDPPRGLRFENGIASWEYPIDTSRVTSYRIYLSGDDDASIVAEVPAGQNNWPVTAGGTDLFVSSYNDRSGTESVRVQLGSAVTPAAVVSSNATTVVVTLGVTATVIGDIAPVADNKFLIVRIEQDSVGQREVGFDSVYFHPVPTQLNPDPNSYSVYLFVGFSGKWLSVGTPVTGQDL